MASSTSKAFAIFRLTAPADTEGNIVNNEAIGFDYGVNEITDAGIISWRPSGDKRRTDISNPDQEVFRKPDTGNANMSYDLDFIINEKSADSVAVAKLFKFYLQRNEVRKDFKFGRVGIRNDKQPFLNVNPDSTAGCKIVHVEVSDDISWGGFLHGSFTILYDGDPVKLTNNIDVVLP